MGTAARPKRLSIYSVLKPRQSRSKYGCLPCRARRKKCGEERPVCHSCEKLKERCTWPTSSLSESSKAGSTTASRSHESQQLPGGNPTGSQRGTQRISCDILHGDESRTSANEPKASPWYSEAESHETEDSSPPLTELRNLERLLLQCGVLTENGSPIQGLAGNILGAGGADVEMLFDHFCHKTVPWLLNSDRHDHLILQYIVPLAITDTLVLHTVLALSGIHLRRSMPSIEAEAVRYYTSALSGLNHILSNRSRSQATDYRVLLTTIILLCHYEFIDGGTYGAAVQHVRACREFIVIALEHLHELDHRELVVLLVESYGYFSLIANIGDSVQREDIRLGLEFSTSILPLIEDQPCFGSMFAFEPEGLLLTPLIARLSMSRKHGASVPMDQHYRALYTALQEDVRSGEPTTNAFGDESMAHAISDKMQLVKNIKTNTLLMYLQASFYQRNESSETLAAELRPLIDRTMDLLTRVQATDATYGLFWCFMVLGSFLRNKQTQESLVQQLEMIRSRTPSQEKGIQLLRCLWDDPDDTAFGLVGLEKIAIVHGANSFIC